MVTRGEAAQLLVSQAPHFQLAEAEVSGIPLRLYVNAPRSLRSLLESSALFGEREFLVYENERRSARRSSPWWRFGPAAPKSQRPF